MATNLFGLGVSAMATAQAGLLTAGHNIANANTPNYSRQRIEQAPNTPLFSGGGFVGQGVHLETVQRAYDALLGAEFRTAQSQASHSQAYSDQLARIDSLLSDPASGVSPAIDDFFSGVHDMASSPGDASARQNLLSSAQAMASRFNEMANQLTTLRRSTNERIAASVGEVNSIGTQLAQLNRQIDVAGRGGSQPPNDLLDKRDALALGLARQVNATIVVADSGAYDVFLGSGQALVLGDKSFTISARPDPLGPENLRVGLQTGASLVAYRSKDLAGGTLGGLLAFRDETLGGVQDSIGRVALALGAAFNAQQKLGLDRNGAPGADFFALSAPQVSSQSAATLTATIADYSALAASDYRLKFDGTGYTLTRLADGTQTSIVSFPQTVDGVTYDLNPPVPAPAANDSFLIRPVRDGAARIGVLTADTGLLAAAAPIRTATRFANTGDARISAGSVDSAYPATPLGGALSLTYSAATNVLTGFPPASPVSVTLNGASTTYAAGAPVPYASGATIAWNGIQLQVSGLPADGDAFSVVPNTNASGDNRNALALAALQTGAALGGATFQQAYGQLTSQVGNKAREMQVATGAQTGLLTQVQAARESVSGVNLDEEAADLLRYQQAYQAAGKMMGIAGTLFDTILGLGR